MEYNDETNKALNARILAIYNEHFRLQREQLASLNARLAAIDSALARECGETAAGPRERGRSRGAEPPCYHLLRGVGVSILTILLLLCGLTLLMLKDDLGIAQMQLDSAQSRLMAAYDAVELIQLQLTENAVRLQQCQLEAANASAQLGHLARFVAGDFSLVVVYVTTRWHQRVGTCGIDVYSMAEVHLLDSAIDRTPLLYVPTVDLERTWERLEALFSAVPSSPCAATGEPYATILRENNIGFKLKGPR